LAVPVLHSRLQFLLRAGSVTPPGHPPGCQIPDTG
jgi:hypothetical protein